MRIIVLCISIMLVACTRVHFSHAKTTNYRRVFDVKSCLRKIRSGSGGSSSGISGFYIRANSGTSSGGGGGVGGNQDGGSANVINLPGTIGSGNAPVGKYDPPTSVAFNRLNNQVGGGRTSDSSFQGWIPIAGPVASNLPGSIGVGASGGFGLSVGNAGAVSYGASSVSTLNNQVSNFQGWSTDQGGNGGAANSGPPEPIGGGYTGGINLPVGNAGSGSYGASSVSTLNNQDENREAASGNNQGTKSSNQVGNGENQVSNGGNQVGNGGFDDSNSLGFGGGFRSASNQVRYFQRSYASGVNIDNHGNNGGVGGGSFQSFSGGSASAHNQGGNLQGYYTYAGSVGNQGGNGGAASVNIQEWSSNQGSNGGNGAGNGGFGGGNSLAFSGGSGGASSQGGSFQSSHVSGGNIANQDGNRGYQVGNGGFGGGNTQGVKGGGNGGNIQGFIKGSSGNSNKSGRSIDEPSAAESSFIDRNSGGYIEIPVGFQTSEGRNVDPELLDQIRTILYREEVNNQPKIYAPSFAYGVPGSGRVVGILIEGINQSIQIAHFHQLSSGLTSPDIPASTLTITPSDNYGAPHK